MIRFVPAKLVFVLTGALLAFTGGGAPAGAIETASFGLDVVSPNADGRLHIEVRAGETTTGRLRVWNKGPTPLTLRLAVAPAQVDEDGSVSLGGAGEGVSWVSVHPGSVPLDPGEERRVEVRVRAPRKLDGGDRVVAVQAEPAPDSGGGQPAVVQRLALTTYLEPDEDSLVAGLGALPWIAVAVLLVVAAAAARSMARRRRPDSGGNVAPAK